MYAKRLFIRCLLSICIVTQALTPTAACGGEFLGRLKRLVGETEYQGTAPRMGHDGAMECLAENIDWLEHHIDTYGSVVAKQPDIWGEARLTKHRDEYERMMFAELNQFKSTLNAAISQGDSAFLAQAFALSAAASGTTGVTPAPETPAPASVSVSSANAQLASAPDLDPGFTRFAIQDGGDSNKPALQLEPVTHLNQMSRYLNHLHELRRINEGDDTSDSPGYSLNLVRIPVSILPGKLTREGFGAEVTITAEPVISDDLMPTTFHNLAVNDVVDFLSLPIVRVTERLDDEDFQLGLETAKSRARFAKTIAVIDAAFYAGELNPENKNLNNAVNDFFDNPIAVANVNKVFQEMVDRIERLSTPSGADYADAGESDSPRSRLDATVQKAVSEMQTSSLQTFGTSNLNLTGTSYGATPQPESVPEETTGVELLKKIIEAIDGRQSAILATHISSLLESSIRGEVRDAIEKVFDEFVKDAATTATVTPAGRARRALNPLNPSSLVPVIGIENLATIAKFFGPAYYGRHIRWSGGPPAEKCSENRVDLLDAQRFLQAEIEAAHELLSQPAHVTLLAQLAAPNSQLASQIRSGHFERDPDAALPAVESYRRYFFDNLHRHADAEMASLAIELPAGEQLVGQEQGLMFAIANADPSEKARNSVEALAWALVVESALLNDRLNHDVRKLAEAKDAYELNTQRDYWFFLPDSVLHPEQDLQPLQVEFQLATEVFKQYVRARWPIHVFAVDPVNQDQNVADVSQRKRELQFALALGFATGKIGGNSLTQFSRRLESQVETISLNQTIVGFGHGTDTFGWRFYPRVQALPVPGTFGAIRETLCGTSRDYDLAHRKLEAGQRECTAVVLMPSFVPYADFDIRSNWFKLTNPKNAGLTMKESLKLSRAVTAMRNSRAQCAECQHLYRDGELRRLFKRVDQLDRELPLQTQRALVPYENTLGGFEMFNTGVTDLAPELIGWYGAPGVNVTDNFGCGCYQGCGLIGGGGCEGEECTQIQQSLTTLSTKVAALETTVKSAGTELRAEPLAACQGQGTTLFLVGDNFSVHDTKVIAGGVCIPHVRLISRELMQVTIPSCINTVSLCENGTPRPYVAVYVATPYGVTNHLHVPVHNPVTAAAVAEEAKLKAAVQAEVKKQVDDLNLPSAVSTVSAKDGDKIVATATKSLEGGLTTFTLRRDIATEGRYATFESPYDPRFQGAKVNVKVSASVMANGHFLLPLQPVAAFEAEPGKTFEALGDAINPANYVGEHLLLQTLASKLPSLTFPADGKPLELKIVYYASFDHQEVPIRLKKEIDLEIKLVDNCGCGNRQTSHNELSASLVDVHERFPVRYAQLEQLGPELLDAPAGELDVLGLEQRFSRLEAKLDATLQLVAGRPSVLPAAAPVAESNVPSQITVNVAMPELAIERAHKRRHQIDDYPMLNRMKVGLGEHWRNVRDTLPCN
ncbi:hypothetical protein [Roseimaritima ulvae]|uniref:IPT/TIG domain protein n=1 Tax=Roseimaritima ulvae TaxID=980254 RepID=A0A5B9R0Q0_9BACT|nr:hypothetical protein [Roseimaritima ulvae]QEG43839.1 hypothetical protein UC8_58960 [Roseimaritima ulvae]